VCVLYSDNKVGNWKADSARVGAEAK
jgi:hypothetical protein